MYCGYFYGQQTIAHVGFCLTGTHSFQGYSRLGLVVERKT